MIDEIVRARRADVAQRVAECPLAGFRARLQPSGRSLEAALREARTGFILECKRSSPSAGLLREDFDPATLARAYGPFADGISVLTEPRWFGGSPEDLEQVRPLVACPVLCKDFVVDPWQVYEARLHGADAILLMLRVLDDDGWRACAAAASEVGMDVLTEAHDEAEMQRALRLGARIIGINNRDLGTLRINLGTTPRLAAMAPAGQLLVCESGIGSHADVVALRGTVDAFLVGSALMRSLDVEMAVRQLIHGRVKVCGLRRVEDARAAWEAGATWGGLVFAWESPRFVDVATACRLREAVPRLSWAGVFVNEAPGRIAEIAERVGLDAVQLHGEEDDATVAEVRALVPASCEVWKAARVRDSIPSRPAGADRQVLDAFSGEARGGTGRSFDWRLLDSVTERERVVLAGGLRPGRLAEAERAGAWALDVSSGVEETPGVKSAALLATFFGELRGVRPGAPQDARQAEETSP